MQATLGRLVAALFFFALCASVSAGGGSPILSCATELGTHAANARAQVCRDVSPATHPPCHSANSCARIEEEIARSCALFDGQGAPMPGCLPAPTSQAAAAAVVRRYYSALNAQDFDTAWAQWGDQGPPADQAARFRTAFERARSIEVTLGALPPAEGAAGSVYQTVPVTVQATFANGTQRAWRGTYTLRRVNGVDGASLGQRRWHISTAALDPINQAP